MQEKKKAGKCQKSTDGKTDFCGFRFVGQQDTGLQMHQWKLDQVFSFRKQNKAMVLGEPNTAAVQLSLTKQQYLMSWE